MICGLSGGVDSSVAAVLVHRAIGDQLTCIFVNNGVLRKNEFQKVQENLRDKLGLNIDAVDATDLFLGKLAKVKDPEKKRKIIGKEFITVFEQEARRIAETQGKVDWLVQGTLYPDVIESQSVRGPSQTIKSHHNVGGLPKRMKLKLIEPLKDLFKDEVRKIGRDLGMPEDVLQRQPFPGPGLAVRILGEVTPDRVALLQEADDIVVTEIKRAGLYTKIWQSFAVLLPVKSVGVMGDMRTYAYACAIRAVNSEDGMTADWVDLPTKSSRPSPTASSTKSKASTASSTTSLPSHQERSSGSEPALRGRHLFRQIGAKIRGCFAFETVTKFGRTLSYQLEFPSMAGPQHEL